MDYITKILIVDDLKENLLLLEKLLENMGVEIIYATSGKEALKLVKIHRFALALIDIMMPEMDGYELSILLRKEKQTKTLPIIFLTAQALDKKQVLKGYETGAVDYMTKPFHPKILKSKIKVFAELDYYRYHHEKMTSEKVSELKKLNDILEKKVEDRTRDLQDALRQVAYREEEIEKEQKFAQSVFANIINPCFLHAVNIKYLISPLSVFNGDILLVARNYSGQQFILLGDFSGRGLRSAIGAIPVSDVFYTMTDKGFFIDNIAFEINKKLKKILPTGIYMSASIVAIDPSRNKLYIWNGGMPDILIHKQKTNTVKQIKSTNEPLGVKSIEQFDKTLNIYNIDKDDRIYIYSDGVLKSINEKGEVFGLDRLINYIKNNKNPDKTFEGIIKRLKDFRIEKTQRDDITILELSYPELCMNNAVKDVSSNQEIKSSSMKWRLVLELNADVLRNTDPVPLIMQLVSSKSEFEAHKSFLFTILSELLTNSLDHGLLGLNSSIKNEPEGFALYFKERKKALAFIEKGSIKVDMEHIPLNKGGKFIFRIEDTGPGFDYNEVLSRNHNDVSPVLFSGRGIMIVRSLCEKLVYKGNGNNVEAVYTWQ